MILIKPVHLKNLRAAAKSWERALLNRLKGTLVDQAPSVLSLSRAALSASVHQRS